MLQKKINREIKRQLHPRNKHRGRYDFKQLIESCPDLASFVFINKYNDESIDFSNPEAIKTLNSALLKHFYGITFWDIPNDYLCPPIPGRVDYIHNIADLLAKSNKGKIPTGKQIKCLDVGVGANCIYPILGYKEYAWSFVGTDIDPLAIQNANQIIESNHGLKENIEIRLQSNLKDIFVGVIRKGEKFDLTLCNPPFHGSAKEAQAGTLRKLSNLKGEKINQAKLNFGGLKNELWCEGGEKQFVQNMIFQSREFAQSCLWFTTLISKETNLKKVYIDLKKVKAEEVKTIQMGQGNKISRIVAWTFFDKEGQNKWFELK